MKKKIIILTGALGQDGQILSRILLKKKFKVYGVVKNLRSSKIEKVTYKKINLNNYKQLSQFLDKINPHALVHLGTENPNYLELKKKIDFYKKNLEATKNLIDYFSKNKNKKKLILIGSSQMYGNSKKRVGLNSKFEPINSYAKFRVEAHHYMLKKKRKFHSNITTAILFNHDSLFRKKKFLIPRLSKIIKAKQFGKLKKIYEENISGDFSHAEDICFGIYKLINLNRNPDKLIFSSNKKTKMNDIINYLLKLSKMKIKIKSNLINNSFTPTGNNSYTKKILNWKLKKNIYIASKEIFLLK